MVRTTLVVLIVAGTSAGIATVAFGRSTATTPKLSATVGPGYTISLKQNGTPVKMLKAGAYSVTFTDKASIHAFSLDGPSGYAVDFTKIPYIGVKIYTVHLKPGNYKFYCPSHESTMFGRFKAT